MPWIYFDSFTASRFELTRRSRCYLIPNLDSLIGPTASRCFVRNGGRGRIRTSVARKERQIYSLLVLATHPPVRTGKPPSRSSAQSLPAKRHPLIRIIHAGNSLSFLLSEIDRRPAPLRSKKISWRRDLNPRPSDYKSDALPTELRQRSSNQKKITKGQLDCKRSSKPRAIQMPRRIILEKQLYNTTARLANEDSIISR